MSAASSRADATTISSLAPGANAMGAYGRVTVGPETPALPLLIVRNVSYEPYRTPSGGQVELSGIRSWYYIKYNVHMCPRTRSHTFLWRFSRPFKILWTWVLAWVVTLNPEPRTMVCR
jgi:hypothetical protein